MCSTCCNNAILTQKGDCFNTENDKCLHLEKERNSATLSEYCLPYVKVGGYFISYKSGEIEEELQQSKRAVSILGGTLGDVIKFALPGTDIGRSFVKIKKVKNTGKKYPRKAGLPSKEPLV